MYSNELKILEKELIAAVRGAISEEVEKIMSMHIDDKSPLLTITDLSVKLKVTKATIHNYLKKGLITGEKMGKNRYFKMVEVSNAMKKYGYKEAHAIGRYNSDQTLVEWQNRDEANRDQSPESQI